jgi:hypothetical protein
MKLLTSVLFVIFISLSIINAQEKKDLAWPREFDSEFGEITVYQPQLESFKDNILEGRMAVSIKPKEKDMLFCAAWFKAKMDTDLDSRLVTLDQLEITKIHFPDIDDKEKIDRLSKILVEEAETWDVEMTLDRQIASLSEVDN